MDIIFDPPMSLDVPEDERAYNARIKLIRKLRWIGMEDEAARVQMTLVENHEYDMIRSATRLAK